jgi:hypothetical protein
MKIKVRVLRHSPEGEHARLDLQIRVAIGRPARGSRRASPSSTRAPDERAHLLPVRFARDAAAAPRACPWGSGSACTHVLLAYS